MNGKAYPLTFCCAKVTALGEGEDLLSAHLFSGLDLAIVSLYAS